MPARLKVLVTGAAGQLGRALAGAFDGWEVVAADRSHLDVTDRALTHAAVLGLQPDAVVHAGAMTAVDACEDDPDRAFAVNALGTRHIAEAARRAAAHLCYLSTDYVFDGTKPGPYAEWDETGPLSVYGRSKLAGERECGPDATVVRTSWVCGDGPGNFVGLVLRLASEHDVLRFVTDQRSRPSIATDVAAMIRRLVAERRSGCFHVTNAGDASRYELARSILGAAGLDPARVEPIDAADLDPPQRAPRPAQSVLDNAALRLAGIPTLPDYRESLVPLVRSLR